jgi:putative mRNA 3-end processing factor
VLLELDDRGIYCAAGGFHIDPWRPVERALITHAHSDHARWGSQRYLTSSPGEPFVRARVGDEANITGIPYGQQISLQGVNVSFHPAGHIPGSAQIRVEHRGEVWVVTGDYKLEPDATCTPFEPVSCHTLITEATFGLPIYRWKPQTEVFEEINAWWRENQSRGRTSVLFAYALGKSQRLLAGVDPAIGPIAAHGAVRRFLPLYEDAGVALPDVLPGTLDHVPELRGRGLIIAPPSVEGSPWLTKYGAASTAFASGWMQVRGHRRRRAADRGFVLSDHIDWPALMHAIEMSGAERVLVTHSPTAAVVARYLTETGRHAEVLATAYAGEEAEAEEAGTPE